MTAQTNYSAANYQDDWIPIEWDSEVVMRVLKSSSVEALAERHTMATSTKRILRQQSYLVTAGKEYTRDDGDLDYVTLTARRFMGQSVLDEDDTADANMIVDTVSKRAQDWAISYATSFDNACLGVTAAEDGINAPFTSVYKAIKTTDSAAGYTGSANYVNHGGAATAAYADLSATLRLVETSDYWDEGSALVIANPAFREVLRNVKDTNGRPIFVQGQGADSGQPDRLFGVEIFWSRGAKTSPAMSSTPSGNPLVVFVGNRSLLKLGVRSGPESRMALADAHSNVDDIAVKFRSRRGFQLGHVAGFSVLEKTA
ncbi:MAG: phage major capsid protein [Actinobacteria bacterium]|nr:phage major capsid protein [Actinomycetota bacterium]